MKGNIVNMKINIFAFLSLFYYINLTSMVVFSKLDSKLLISVFSKSTIILFENL